MELKLTLDELCKHLHKDFFNIDSLIKEVYNALKYDNNLIMYGPGGYGKSTVVEAILKALDISMSTIVGYEDMPVEGMLGMPNMKKIQDESVYETAFDKSPFANNGVLVLEEFLEVAPATLAALKDILTAGGLRQGDKFQKSNIGIVIICTNRDPSELSTNTAAKALITERFPIHYKVEWENYDVQAYTNFIKFLLKDEKLNDKHRVLAELCARNASAVSPRILKVCVSRIKDGLENLNYISGLDTTDMQKVIADYNIIKVQRAYRTLSSSIKSHIKVLMQGDMKKIRPYNDAINGLKYIKKKLTQLECDDATVTDIVFNLLKEVNDTIEFVETNYMYIDDVDTAPIDNIFESCMKL